MRRPAQFVLGDVSMYSFGMETEFLTHPAFWTVVLILALAWKGGSVMERWHQENLQARSARSKRKSLT